MKRLLDSVCQERSNHRRLLDWVSNGGIMTCGWVRCGNRRNTGTISTHAYGHKVLKIIYLFLDTDGVAVFRLVLHSALQQLANSFLPAKLLLGEPRPALLQLQKKGFDLVMLFGAGEAVVERLWCDHIEHGAGGAAVRGGAIDL